ncbi:MAG: carboxypeptidase-like regulatory domain-containing protein [Fuerstiella sp.]
MKQFTAALLSLSLVCISGCGGGPEGGQPVFEVTGNVKMNGAILADATVIFSPVDKQPTATGKTDAEGNFTMTTYEFGDGAAAGKYKVLVSKSLVKASSGGGADDAGHEQDPEDSAVHGKGGGGDDIANLVPDKFSRATTTTLDATVEADKANTFSFEVTP